MGVKLTGTLRSCKECLSARGIRKPSPKQTAPHSDKKLGCVYADLLGPQETRSLGKKRYVVIFQDDFSRYM